jgi:microcystin-dependent protein
MSVSFSVGAGYGPSTNRSYGLPFMPGCAPISTVTVVSAKLCSTSGAGGPSSKDSGQNTDPHEDDIMGTLPAHTEPVRAVECAEIMALDV